MIRVNNNRLLRRKLLIVRQNLTNARTRNKRLTVALEYYSKYHNTLFGVGPKVAREALRD